MPQIYTCAAYREPQRERQVQISSNLRQDVTETFTSESFSTEWVSIMSAETIVMIVASLNWSNVRKVVFLCDVKIQSLIFSPKSSYTGWQENRKHYQTLLESQQVGGVSKHSLILIEYHWLSRLDSQFSFCARVEIWKKFRRSLQPNLTFHEFLMISTTYWDGIDMKRSTVQHFDIKGVTIALLHGLKM